MEGIVVVVGISAGVTVVVVVFGPCAGSRVERSAGTLMEGLAGKILVVVSVNRGEVAGRLTGTVTRTGPATTDLICSLYLLTLPSGFF